MTTASKAVCWAVAMLFVAAGAHFGFMDRDAAMTVLLVLPIVAVLSLTGRLGCAGRAR